MLQKPKTMCCYFGLEGNGRSGQAQTQAQAPKRVQGSLCLAAKRARKTSVYSRRIRSSAEKKKVCDLTGRSVARWEQYRIVSRETETVCSCAVGSRLGLTIFGSGVLFVYTLF